jgi:hypothetical protein
MERVAGPIERRSSLVQLEIPLPTTSDSIWVKAEVIYDRFDALFHGTAVRFTGMARPHLRLLRDWLREVGQRERALMFHPFRSPPRVERPAGASI